MSAFQLRQTMANFIGIPRNGTYGISIWSIRSGCSIHSRQNVQVCLIFSVNYVPFPRDLVQSYAEDQRPKWARSQLSYSRRIDESPRDPRRKRRHRETYFDARLIPFLQICKAEFAISKAENSRRTDASLFLRFDREHHTHECIVWGSAE